MLSCSFYSLLNFLQLTNQLTKRGPMPQVEQAAGICTSFFSLVCAELSP